MVLSLVFNWTPAQILAMRLLDFDEYVSVAEHKLKSGGGSG